VTPPHSAGIYYLFGFFFFGTLFASSCSRRLPLPWVPSTVRRSPFCLIALVVLCVHVPVGLHVIGIRAAQAAPPSGTLAAGCDLAWHRTIVSAIARLRFAASCMCGPCVVLVCAAVRSLCVVASRECASLVSAHRSRLSCYI
jgi:hypothetical protein